MAPRESSRHGEREPSKNRHKRKPSSSAKKKTETSTSDESRSGGSSHQLSADALAQFNRQNARAAPSPKESRREREREEERDREQERIRELEREKRRSRGRERERERERARDRRRSEDRYRDYDEEDQEEVEEADLDRDYERDRRRDRPRRAESREYDREGRRKRDSRTRAVSGGEEIRVSKPKKERRDEYREVSRYPVEPEEVYRNEKYRDKRKSRRAVSGAVMEEGASRGLRGGAGGSTSYDSWEKDDLDRYPPAKRKWNRKKLLIGVGIIVVGLIIIIAVAVVVSKKNSGDSSSSSGSSLAGVVVPSGAPDWLNPYTWVDTTDFNVTYTSAMVGDLPIMGLYSTWDDSAQANPYVPALNQAWGSYASRPARGVNIGGWLSIEPFITPSLFNYDSSKGIIDEYTLCAYLGTAKCASTLENHYATFVTEATFSEIAAAGLDHVRIPYSYWAVQTYDGDPYLYRTSWRYLLRGIEWARKHGLRVNLDLHALPGSQNGWNHSGRQGPIGWFNGTNGTLNAQRSLDVHDRLSKFFAQDRYRNVISHYGLANEPKMTYLSVTDVLNWTASAYALVRKNGLSNATVVFGDGFRGLGNWQGELTGYGNNLALDVHQYVIFNTNQIVYNHTQKVQYACDGWTQQTEESMDTSTGFGPTMVAEWSQADTDCAKYLNNVGWGTRWTGTYVTGNSSLDITTPRCPLTSSSCECTDANADASVWSDAYKEFLLYFAEAQMTSFEKGWGWWYWVWDTESAPQWSYKKGLAAGILPAKAYSRTFGCNMTIPSFSGLPEYY